MRRLAVLCLSGGVALLPGVAASQPSSGQEFRVNAYTTGQQVVPDVAVDAATGRFVVVWKQEASSFCKGQRFDAAGAPEGIEVFVSAACPGGVAVATTPGGFAVAAVDGTLVSGRRITVSPPAFTDFTVNTYTTGFNNGPAIASAANGDFVVVWSNAAHDGSGYGVFARRYLVTGEPAGLQAEFRVNSSTTGDQRNASVARDAAGDFIVVWQSRPAVPGVFQIYGQRYSASGSPTGGEFRIDTAAGVGNYFPKVASDSTGNFVVAWTSYGLYGGSSYNVLARRFSSSGAPLGGPFRVNAATNGTSARVDVAHPDGGFVVVWQELQADSSGYAVMGRRYAADGTSLAGPYRVNSYTTGDQSDPAIAARPGGAYVVVWDGTENAAAGHDIFGQRYCLDGDVNADGNVDVLDVFYLINALFAAGPAPLGCADVNGDATVDVTDVFYLINHLFAGGPPPV